MKATCLFTVAVRAHAYLCKWVASQAGRGVLVLPQLLLAQAFVLPAAQAQGTWLRTGCLAAAGATVTINTPPPAGAVPSALPTTTTRTVAACKAAPAWGSTGSEYVQAALALADAASVTPPGPNAAAAGTAGAAAATPPSTGPSTPRTPSTQASLKTSSQTDGADSADSEALLVSFTQRAQLASILLGYLDARAPLAGYRWNGPTATEAALAALAAPATGAAGAAPGQTSAIANGWQLMSNPGLGGNPRGSSGWLQGVYAGATETQPVSVATLSVATPALAMPSVSVSAQPANAGAQLPFLAATCPQVEGKAVAGSSDRCTVAVNTVPEPSTWALVGLAVGLMGAVRAGRGRHPLPASAAALHPLPASAAALHVQPPSL
jgi:hypothetical protein